MSDKAALCETSPLLAPQRRSPRYRVAMVTILSFLAVGSLLVNFYSNWAHGFPNGRDEDKEGDKWSWQDMKSHKTLEWESCYLGQFQCARLEVPMNWQDPTDERRVILGVMKLPAKSKGPSVPPLFMNPGGPGGSGIAVLQIEGPLLQKIAGDHHDIISWDPRGVGLSTPRMDCWGSYQKRQLWMMQESPVVDERPGLIYDAYGRAAAFSRTCEEAMNETGIMKYLSTASSARDLLELVEQTGHSKLRYWGFSYGTILGGVFASMYPDRVERLVSDGNVDYTSWFEQDHSRFVKDADAIFDTFDEACSSAGPEKCDLWAPQPDGVRERRDNLLKALKQKPVLIPSWATPTGPELPILVTYGLLQALTRGMLYKPLATAPVMARIYAALERGDGMPFYDTVLAELGNDGDPMSKLLCSITETPATEPKETVHELDAFPAIMCSDGVPVNDTPEELAQYLEKIRGVSKWIGAANMNFRLPCVGRTVRPEWRFVPQANIQVETDHPILFIGNLYDNVTPLESAHNNSAHFPGSVVLQQNTLGHCSTAAPSVCTARYVRAYFDDGTLPDVGTKCEQDYNLFETPEDDVLDAQDELSSAVYNAWKKADFGFEQKRLLW